MVYRIDNTTAAQQAPAVTTGTGQPGFFTNGNPVTGQPATVLDDWWLNMVQEELAAVIAAAGLALDKTNNAQLLAAIRQLILTGGAGGSSSGSAENGFLPLAGGTLSGDLLLSGNEDGSSLYSRSLRMGINAVASEFRLQLRGQAGHEVGNFHLTDSIGNAHDWGLNAANNTISTPGGNTALEVLGTSRQMVQPFVVTADNGWTIPYPVAFSAIPSAIIVNPLDAEWDVRPEAGSWGASSFKLSTNTTNTAGKPQRLSVLAIGPVGF